ncbi:hypothetical protein RHSIM_Rhsim11G0074000 [Rhododendron simsii]|uniref:Uncharacterized protein n=1 Tax=Rhododendron simsii TaxID=118357 RepID=A0A834LA24_RHOSS|nr:hypothetical protein RHSIM_Rhsim11G0074000 [Rhododendron simsii]
MLRTLHLQVPNSNFQNLASSTTNEDGGKEIKEEMEAKQGEKVVRAKGGGATEAVVANPIAGAARTKSAAASLVPPQRKSVKQMMGDATVKAAASCFCSSDQQKDKIYSA